MKNSASKISKIVYGLLASLVILGLWVLFRNKPVPVETATVTRGIFTETLRVDGTVKSKKKITIVAYATGDLGRVDWKAGEPIRKGQTIAILTWDVEKPIVSTIEGIIAKVYRESAGPILRGEPIVDIIDPNDVEIVAEILTTDAIRIPEKAAVLITGFGNDESLKAEVERVSRAGFVKLSALGIEEEKTEVYVRLKETPQSSLGDTFHVELHIDLFQKENAIKIPLGALFKNQKSWAVYVVVDKKAQLRNVVVSKKNETEALISEGLQPNEQVILFPGDQVADGSSVRIKK